MAYHYHSHTTTTISPNGNSTHTSVVVRELDDGEVGILMAGNNSIFDPSLTPRMLAVPTTDYDVQQNTLQTDDEDEEDSDDNGFDDWFPSLRHLSWIHGLDDDDDDDDDIMVDRMMETLFASAVMEQEEERSRRQTQSRRPTKKQEAEEEDHSVVELVPIDVIYIRF
ncbi:hypothetical protein [Absidia glauca]|uniref:Uncharacterized protein n=1 Tax=Absidia glauca TaxID=4829 RepID=A0A163KPS5_ABSGL|nr:hypothetical protein [Absidia glauca]